MKRVVWLLLCMWVALMAGQAVAATKAYPFVTDLIAGNPKNFRNDIGDVRVWDDGSKLYIKIVIPDDSPWAIAKTHVAVASSLAGIPQVNGNPVPGQFPYKKSFSPFTERVLYDNIPLPSYSPIYIAVHANAYTGSPKDLQLPCLAKMTVTSEPDFTLQAPSYFPVTVAEGGILNGTYNAWCASTDLGIGTNITYDVRVFSSIDENLPTCLFSGSEEWDAINWILNYISPPKCYNWAEVQAAIWILLGETLPSDNFPPYNAGKVAELVAKARCKGADFEPGCSDVVAVILVPVSSTDCAADVCSVLSAQPVIIPVKVPCVKGETAWAEGPGFPGSNWAMYFTYTPNSANSLSRQGITLQNFFK